MGRNKHYYTESKKKMENHQFLVMKDGKLIDDPMKVAFLFNQYYANVAPDFKIITKTQLKKQQL